ncbi:dTMP kinase [Porcipelethomonas sp.]|uniref:dTMP kinase n=1 Tax=Porcipelethomonas sp. TaxID=2981675 RepID=UPI003EF134EC
MKKGKIIVIDGLDGCGKSTQLELVKINLEKSGYNVRSISFPDYNNPSSALVKMYLNGEFAEDPEGVNAYAASSFYAVDRYASYMKYWKSDYESGKIIISARYVSSNAVHQMSKLPKDCWDNYLDWLYDYEYNKLGLPEADKTIFLDMPVSVSQKFISERYNGDESKKDIHESHIEYLEQCRKSALYAAEKLSWSLIKCSENNIPLSIERISSEIMNEISEVI